MRKKIMFTDPSLTIESESEKTDINYLIERARVTGAWSSRNSKEPIYLDCVGLGDYQASLERIQTANNAFLALPARVRDRFANSPNKMVEFLLDPKNKAEAVELGLLKPPVQPAAQTPGKPETKDTPKA